MRSGIFEAYPVKQVARGQNEYPLRLKDLKHMPSCLHYRGSLPGNEPTVAIVGSRRSTPYGRWQAELYAKVLVGHGVSIISGMAAGIDAAAQRAALDAGGRSFAVLGTGADVCYPASSRDLYERLLKNGGVISEYDNGTPPLGYHFPARNRLISGLADVVLVVEAAERSGSLITADFALEQGRSVFAVPGRIGDIHSEGCLRLIAEGAYVALSPDEVLRELYRVNGVSDWDGLRARGSAFEDRDDGDSISMTDTAFIGAKLKGDTQLGDVTVGEVRERDKIAIDSRVMLTKQEREIMTVLTHEAISMEDIIEKTGHDVRACAVAMAALMEKGLAVEVYDQAYVRKD